MTPQSPDPQHIHIGQSQITSQGKALCVVCGCSVVVTLHQRYLGFGGLCHFDQPWGKGKDLNTRHANGAILSLARRLKDMGARRQQLDAQIIGGACRLHSNFCHADQCVKMAKRILKKFNIPIVSTDTGGRFGRKVIFNPKSGEVAVVKTQKLRASDWNCLGS